MSLFFWSRVHSFALWAQRTSATLMEVSWAKATQANIAEINKHAKRRDFCG